MDGTHGEMKFAQVFSRGPYEKVGFTTTMVNYGI
jgi:hypothetical protein